MPKISAIIRPPRYKEHFSVGPGLVSGTSIFKWESTCGKYQRRV